METPTRPSSPPSAPIPPHPRSSRPKTLTGHLSSRCEVSTINPLKALLSDPSPGPVKKSSSKGLPLSTRKKSSSNRELESIEGRDVRRTSFGDTAVDVLPGDNVSHDVVGRGRNRNRGPGKRSSTPFFRRRLSSDDVDDDGVVSEDISSSSSSPRQAPETRTVSRISQLPRRNSSRSCDVDGAGRETIDHEKGRRVRFVEGPAECLPGDSSGEEVLERGRGRDRGPGKRSSTPFVRRRVSSRDDTEDDDYGSEDMSSSSSSSRQAPGKRIFLRGSQVTQREISKSRDTEGANIESCDREELRRVNFAEKSMVEYLPGDSSDEENHQRGRGRARRPRRRSATPFFRRTSSSRAEDGDIDDTCSSSTSPRLTNNASKGIRPTRRRSRKCEDGENVNQKRASFVKGSSEYVPGDSSDEDIVESGREGERAPDTDSCAFTKRSSRSSEDNGITACQRCRVAMELSYCNVDGLDVEPQN